MHKILELPIIIQREVNIRVSKANPIILELALEKFEYHQRIYFQQKFYRVNTEWHLRNPKPAGRDRGCGCDYCLVLFRYVVEKITEHRLRKRMDNYWYEPFNHYNDQEALKQTKELYKHHKIVKDQIKQEIGL